MEELGGKETLNPVRVIDDVKDFHPSCSSDEWNLVLLATISSVEDSAYAQSVIDALNHDHASENVVVSLQNGFTQQQELFVHGLTYLAATTIDAGIVSHKADGDTILPPGTNNAITCVQLLYFPSFSL